jgi:NDP-sugar pyrophosphorylase family protein
MSHPPMKAKAMIFAAGLGTRLRPLTDDCPKALVDINGRTLLEITLSRLRSFGVTEVVINVHHFADRIMEYLRTNENFGMRIDVSREDVLLDTGGGLKKAAYFLLGNSGASSPLPARELSNYDEAFIVHNVDVLSNIDLGRMLQFHCETQALATLAVQNRPTSRYLLFDNYLRLCGRKTGNGQPELLDQRQPEHTLAFSGIHIVSPRLLDMLTEEGAFSITTAYLRLAAQREKIQAFRADGYYWRDLGTPENLAQAAEDMQRTLQQ